MILKNLFSSNLKLLNLSNNEIDNLDFLNKENVLINLETLNLSCNKIIDISPIITCKLTNLKSLDLSNNKISDIKCFENDDLPFMKLKTLDLSNNLIKKMNKINIKNLENLSLLKNNISYGINELFSDLFYCKKLILEKYDNELIFNYSNNVNINFNYIIENNDINNILRNLSFKSIEDMELKGFDNIDFLNNESLNKLKILDLKENKIEDITIFNDIKFINVEKIIFNSDSITKGYNSLNIFKSIKAKLVEIDKNDNKYMCNIHFEKPEINNINFIFNDLDFLKDELLATTEQLGISKILLDTNNFNLNFFIDESIRNSYPIFRNMKIKLLKINYIDNKYSYDCEFLEPYLNINYDIEELNIIESTIFDNGEKEISIINSVLDDKFDLFKKKLDNVKCLNIENNTIKTMQIFNDIPLLVSLKSDNNVYMDEATDNIFQNFGDEKFIIENISSEGNDLKAYFKLPFNFHILFTKKNFKDIKSLNDCISFCIEDLELIDEDLEFLKNISFINLKELYLNQCNIINIDFLSNESLTNLEELSLNSNKIEDISIFKNEKISFKCLNYLSIKGNPIRKGIDVLNDDFFQRCLWVNVYDDFENDNENKIYYNSKYPKYEIEFFINNNDDIKNMINFENNIIDFEYNGYENEIFNKIMEKCCDNTTIYIKEGDNIAHVNSILFNTSNKDEYIKVFQSLLYKTKKYPQIKYFDNLLEVNLYNISSESEDLVKNLFFYKLQNLILYNCKFDLNVLQYTSLNHLKKLDLSNTQVYNITGICNGPFVDLEILNLSNNQNIENLNELKNATFKDLKKLYLSNDGIRNLNDINMGEYPFKSLIALDLSNNHLDNLDPIDRTFTSLELLDIKNNSLQNKEALNNIKELNKKCEIIE